MSTYYRFTAKVEFADNPEFDNAKAYRSSWTRTTGQTQSQIVYLPLGVATIVDLSSLWPIGGGIVNVLVRVVDPATNDYIQVELPTGEDSALTTFDIGDGVNVPTFFVISSSSTVNAMSLTCTSVTSNTYIEVVVCAQ